LFTTNDLSNDQKRVGGIFGFIKQIFTLAKKFETNRFIFCWDSRNSYRKLRCPSYKSSRRKDLTEAQAIDMQDAFRQFDEIREILLPCMGFNNSYQQSGYEADDLIAHISMRLPDNTIIASTDNDLLQLIRHDRFCPIKIYNFKGVTDEAEFKKAWYGLAPIKWSEVKAIAGCGSDEVKGIVGIGEATAAKYLMGLVKGKSLEKIESKEGKAIAYGNMSLVCLPYADGLKPIKIWGLYEDSLSLDKFKAVFGQYGFRSLLKEEEIYKWSKSFFGGDNGGKSGTNSVRKIQRG
jgi:5'-3' exonuclease